MPIAQTSNFLVPNGTFIFELIAFLIVLGVIGWKVLPPLNKMLAERQEQIRGEIEAAEEAKTDAEQADAERRRELETARQQAREIVAQANRTADQIATRSPEPSPSRIRAHRELGRCRSNHRPSGRHREHHGPRRGDRPCRRRAGHRAGDPGFGPPGPDR